MLVSVTFTGKVSYVIVNVTFTGVYYPTKLKLPVIVMEKMQIQFERLNGNPQ